MTRIEREKIIPHFNSRTHFRWWMSQWYYPSEHWARIHTLVVRRGRCGFCGHGKRIKDPFQAHHAKGAYAYLWREEEAMHLMVCAHRSCHMRHHRRPQKKSPKKHQGFLSRLLKALP